MKTNKPCLNVNDIFPYFERTLSIYIIYIYILYILYYTVPGFSQLYLITIFEDKNLTLTKGAHTGSYNTNNYVECQYK